MVINKTIKKGTVYRIYSPSLEVFYIGSTSSTYLSSRFSGHNYDRRMYFEGKNKHKCSSFRILKMKDCKIEALEILINCSKQLLLEREKIYMKMDPINCVNTKNPITPIEEKLQKDKDRNAIYKPLYYLKNKEAVDIKNALYKAENIVFLNNNRNKVVDCICGHTYTQSNRKRHYISKKHIVAMALIN